MSEPSLCGGNRLTIMASKKREVWMPRAIVFLIAAALWGQDQVQSRTALNEGVRAFRAARYPEAIPRRRKASTLYHHQCPDQHRGCRWLHAGPPRTRILSLAWMRSSGRSPRTCVPAAATGARWAR